MTDYNKLAEPGLLFPKKETPPPTETVPSALPTSEELFPEQVTLLQEIGTNRKRIQSKIDIASAEYEKLVSQLSDSSKNLETTSLLDRPLHATLQFGNKWSAQTSREKLNADIAQQLSVMDSLYTEYHRENWKETVVSGLPFMLSRTDKEIKTSDEALSLFSSKYITDTDRAWFTEQFDLVTSARKAAITQGVISPATIGEIEARELLLATQNRAMVNVHTLTLTELGKYLQPPQAKELPATLTAADLLAISDELSASPEYKETFTNINKIATELENAWIEAELNTDVAKAGLTANAFNELPLWKKALYVITYPIQPILEGLEAFWFKPVVYPLIGAYFANMPAVPGSDASYMKEYVAAYKDKGYNTYEAYSHGAEEWMNNVPFWESMLVGTVFDPTTYIGMGLATKATKIMFGSEKVLAGIKVGTISRGVLGLKLPQIGNFVGAIERGFNEVADIPFVALKGAISKIPLTPRMAAAKTGQAAFLDISSYLTKTSAKTADEIGKALSSAIMAARKTPLAIADPEVKAGIYLLTHDFLKPRQIQSLADKLGASIEVSGSTVHDINNWFELYFKKVNTFTETKTADLILDKLGLSISDESRNVVIQFLKTHTSTIESAARALTKGDNPRQIAMNVSKTIRDTVHQQLTSAEWKFSNQMGMVAEWSRKIESIQRWSWIAWTEKHAVSPMANSYLLFVNYGTYNLIETMMRSFLDGGDVWYPKNADSYGMYNNVVGDLANADYGLIQTYNHLVEIRSETAVFQDATKTALNRIPIVTAPLKIKGKTIGFQIKMPGGLKYSVTSFQDYNEMFSDLQTRLRAHFTLKQYIKELNALNPSAMQKIATVIDNAHELQGMAKFSSQEVEQMKEAYLYAATRSPEAVGSILVPLKQLEINKAVSQTQALLDKCPDIFTPVKNQLLEDIRNGHLFRDIDGYIDKYTKISYEFGIAPIMVQAEQMNRFGKYFASHVGGIKTQAELAESLAFLSQMTDNVFNRVSEYRMLVQNRLGDLLESEKLAYTRTTDSMITKFLDSVQTNMDYMNGLVKNVINGEDFAMDWSKVKFSSDIPVEQVPKMQSWIDNLPLEMKTNIHTIDTNISGTAKTMGNYFWSDRRVAINPEILTTDQGEITFYHEMMHGFLRDKLDQHDYQFLDDFLKVTGMKDTPTYKVFEIAKEQNLTGADFFIEENILPYHLRSSELLSNSFSFEAKSNIDLISTSFQDFVASNSSKFRAFAKTHLPTKLPKVKFSVSNKMHMAQLNDTIQQNHQLLTLTRQKEFDLREQILAGKPKNADTAWWKNTYLRINEIWDEYRGISRNLMVNREGLLRKLSGKRVPEPTKFIKIDRLSTNDIAWLYGVTNSDVSKHLFNLNAFAIQPKADFVAQVGAKADILAKDIAGKTGAELGFTDEAIGRVYDEILRNCGFEPKWVENNPMVKSATQLQELKLELQKLKTQKAIPASDYEKLSAYNKRVVEELKQTGIYGGIKIPIGKEAIALPSFEEIAAQAKATAASWNATREQAILQARQRQALAFTDYSNENAVDSAMKMIFPFWSYESQRWLWLPRTFLRTPGTLTGIAKYDKYSDKGYISIPGTDLQVNVLRGSVFMGGMMGMLKRDYPSYYDSFPGMESLEWINRLGFYPGIHFMLPITMFGMKENLKPNWGELMPAWMKTGLDALVAYLPNSKAVKNMSQIIFPDRFRDYSTVLMLNAKGIDGLALWDKVKSGKPFEPDEEKQWSDAVRRVSKYGILMEQSAVLRLRPREYQEFLKNSRQAMSELTGISPREQEEISRLYPFTGKTLLDYVHIDILQQKIVRELLNYERWSGITAPLTPSSWQQEDQARRKYFDTIDKIGNDARHIGFYNSKEVKIGKSVEDINREFILGTDGKRISGKQWYTQLADINNKKSTMMEAISNSPEYIDVPKTLDDMIKQAQERGQLPPSAFSPDEELLNLYYTLQPKLEYDEDYGTSVLNFEDYYASVDALIESLNPEYRQILLDRIQFEWTPLERLYWQVSREYIRPYKNIRELFLKKYTPEQQATIRRISTAPLEERALLLEQLDPETGRKLYSQFESEVRTAREHMRQLSPELDAWLAFFGRTTTFQSATGGELYQQLQSQYLTEDMIK